MRDLKQHILKVRKYTHSDRTPIEKVAGKRMESSWPCERIHMFYFDKLGTLRYFCMICQSFRAS
jgi:hypothetical protein